MDVWQIVVATLRRWYVFLPLLALTVFVTLRVGQGINPQYEVTATTVLVSAPESSRYDNPYGSLDETNQVLEIVLDDTATREQIGAAGFDPEYVVNARSRSRITEIVVVSATPELALATGEAVIELGQQELAQRQSVAGIPSTAQVQLQVLQAPSVSDTVTQGKRRSMAITFILGGATSALVAVLVDDLMGFLRRRGPRRPRQAGPLTRVLEAPPKPSSASPTVMEHSRVQVRADR